MLLLALACEVNAPDETATPDSAVDTSGSPTLCTDGVPATAWTDGGGTDVGFGALAGDFTVPTTTGDWTLSEHWTGCDSYVFVGVSDDDGYTSMLLDTKMWRLLQDGPQNVHYFILVNGDETLQASLQDIVDKGLSNSDATWWTDRVHLVTEKPKKLDNWLSDAFKELYYPVLGIDRLQKIREIGDIQNALTGWTTAEWYALGYEADLYNFEAARQARLDAENATIVRMFDAEAVSGSGVKTVTLPSAEELQGYDTLEVDLTLDTGDDWYNSSADAWDYLGYLYLYDVDDPDTPDVDESTQAWEVTRFITAYWRGGHWVMDASPLLAKLQQGGDRTFVLYPANPFVVTLDLRFSNQGKGMRPTAADTLWWTSTTFDQNYDLAHPDITFTPPPGTRGVKLVTVITGHGFGSNAENCAEFCNHQHQFAVNGSDLELEEFTMASTDDGCAEQVATKGVTPNQAGTWPYGRGGWCPGLGIDPWEQDVTPYVDLTGTNTISYRGLFEGETYEPTILNYNFSARIDAITWLVYEQ